MITPMTKYSFILLNGEQDALLEKIQEFGLMDITRSTKPLDKKSQKLAGEIELLDGLLNSIRKAEIPEGTQAQAYKGEGSDDIIRLAGGTLMLFTESRNKVQTLEKEIRNSEVWGSFDSDIVQKLSEAGVPLHFHIVSPKAFQESWKDEYVLTVISRRKAGIYFVVFGEDNLPGEVPAPKEDCEGRKDLLAQEKKKLKKLEGEMAYLKEQLPELEKVRDKAYSRLDLYMAGVSAVPAAENTIVTLVGYAPSESDETISDALERAGVLYLKDSAVAEDNPPIQLRNNWFVRQFELLTDMYGRPDYNEFDPTPYISVFFLLFFAMCMGDAGYGLVLVIGGFLLRKVEGMKDLAPLVTILGVGTFVVGIVMHTVFGVDIATLPWIPAWLKSVMITGTIAGFEAQMVLALVIGVVHLCLAMVVKTVYATRNKGFLGSLGTWGWTLLIVGGVVLAAMSMFLAIPAPIFKWTVIGLGIVSALGIFLFNDIKRNPLKNIGSGLWETYNTVTGLLGDVLSYLRLYALGLAGGMLGKAFNDIATMTLGDGGFGWFFFIVILIVGHALNLAMCCLGAFVHPLRLNFLEFFKNSGYDGKGRLYRPVKK